MDYESRALTSLLIPRLYFTGDGRPHTHPFLEWSFPPSLPLPCPSSPSRPSSFLGQNQIQEGLEISLRLGLTLQRMGIRGRGSFKLEKDRPDALSHGPQVERGRPGDTRARRSGEVQTAVGTSGEGRRRPRVTCPPTRPPSREDGRERGAASSPVTRALLSEQRFPAGVPRGFLKRAGSGCSVRGTDPIFS